MSIAPLVEHVAAVPFLDLRPTHERLREELLADIAGLIDSGAFTNGPQVEAFEAAFARFCGRRHCVGVASGLDALQLGLIAAGIQPGDEVIVPAATFVATFEAVTQANGVPVVVDIGDTDYGLDPEAVTAAITPRTRFLLPVHLYGQMADMVELRRLSARYRLTILEDACQAHGATRNGVNAGGSGIGGAFSFYPGKNLGAMGDAGALVTDDADVAAAVRALREHGQQQKYRHVYRGFTSRLDTIQAIVLLRKLPLLDGWTNKRRAVAARYSQVLDGIGDLRLPPVPAGSDPVWHLYVVRTGDPARLADFLSERGVSTGRHYPEPPHLSAAYAALGHSRGSFPVAEALSDEALSLPMFPGMTERQVAAVVAGVVEYFGRS
jgi:dTDP-3-amino-3,4,6-trideoxy-alpha-D-glucose transaminase